MLTQIMNYIFGEPVPVLKEMPAHVANVRINPTVLFLHMSEAHMPSKSIVEQTTARRTL